MNEASFLVNQAENGGFEAHCLDFVAFAEAVDWRSLEANVIKVINATFPTGDGPKILRLRGRHEKTIAIGA